MRAACAAGFVATILAAAGADDKPAKPPEGFAALYNGTDLKGWKATGKADQWSAEPGLIACKGGGGGWLLTEAEYADFELRFEYRWTKEGGNSGVALRTADKGDPSQVGMEIQLIDDENWAKVHKFELKDYQHTGSVYGLAPAKGRKNSPVGEWNAVRVVCKGDAVTIEQNGTELVSADLAELRKKAPKHAGVQRPKGHVGFQSYNSRVEFRNPWLKELK
ncbi:MAG: DUF1080 domain-containing protein [Isosphaera sp.]|nr:DUF1080 domain-containing protein [Isosphaera sp.]